MKPGDLFIIFGGNVTVWCTEMGQSLKTLGTLPFGAPVIFLRCTDPYCEVMSAIGIGWIHRSMLREKP